MFLNFQLAIGVEVKCNFVFYTGETSDGYNCRVEQDSYFKLKIDQRNTSISKISGRHLKFSNNDSVERLYFLNNPGMKFIPIGYSKFFASINNIWIANCPIESIEKSDFDKPEKLEILGIRGSNIQAIGKDVFCDMINLKQLHLYDNKITKIHEESLSKLTNLKILNLPNNKLGYLHRRLFQNNLELQEIYINNNKLKIIDSETFFGLTKITIIKLRDNICINKNYPGDVFSSIIRLNLAISDGCDNPMAEVIEELKNSKTQSDSTISKLLLEKSETDKKIMRKDNEISNLANENKKVRDEIFKLRGDYDKVNISKAELEKELEILSLNHTEAKDEIEKVLNKTFDLELILSDAIQKFNESLEMNEKASHDIRNLQDSLQTLENNSNQLTVQNSQLIAEVTLTKAKLTKALLEREMIENDFKELQTNYSDIEVYNLQLEQKINEFELSNETTFLCLQTHDNSTTDGHNYLIILFALILFITALFIVLLVSLFKKKKTQMYKTNEMEVVFSNEGDDGGLE